MRPFYENETATPRHHLSFLSLSPTSSPAPTIRKSDTQLFFSNPHEMLDYVTRRWQDNFVTSDLQIRAQIEMFVKRPFFLLVSVDAPLYDRYRRSHGFVFSLDKTLTSYYTSRRIYASLEEFVREDDSIVFGDRSGMTSSLHDLRGLIDVEIINSFRTLSSFESYLEETDLLNVEHLRPGWDAYFMVCYE